MVQSLIVVESPTKARTLQKFLGKGYQVLASIGHIKDLPKSKLGVDVESEFKPEYELIKGKGKIVQQIKKAAKVVDEIFLAPDPDREGEAIAWHISEEVHTPGKKIYRALFNDLSKETVQQSLENPKTLDRRKVEAQIARRTLDRLVGYEISPMLWKKVQRGLSAGRVQSVAVRLICERQNQIEAFRSREYWNICAMLEGDLPPPFQVKLLEADKKKVEIPDEEKARRIVRELETLPFRVVSLEKKETSRRPPAPFTTSMLQQEAYRRLRFSAKKTMVLAQQLYEGVELGSEGPSGLITYMRTDSVKVADRALKAVRCFIEKRFGRDLMPAKPNLFKSRKGAQEAHEAIRPIDVDRHPDQIRPFLSEDQFLLYRLIWDRFVASQMKPARYDRTVVEVEAGPYLFRGVGTVMIFPGFTAVYGKVVDGEGEEEGATFPALREGEELKVLELSPEQHFTQPPPAFTEATLVRELEEKGIGRPSTYASILSNIQERGYVRKSKGLFRPTELGKLVTDLLVANFSSILDVRFTAEMEEKLDSIETGRLDRLQVLRGFYESFRQDYSRAETNMQDLKHEGLPTEITCDRCGKEMVIKVGKKGPFLSCSAYPDCKNSQPYVRDSEGQIKTPTEEETREEICPKCGAPMVVKEGRFGQFLACKQYPACRSTMPMPGRKEGALVPESSPPCPECGSNMVLRSGRFGRFFACSRYPQCKGTAAVTIGLDCPRDGCNGKIVEKRSRKGRVFYGCTRFPECRFALWDRPVSKPCPSCGSSFLVEKHRKASSSLACINKGCRFSEPL
jgi:DNA topoisomerase-1